MKSSAAAAAAGGGGVAAGVAISAADAADWLGLVERIATSPVGLLVFCLIFLALLVWLLVRQRGVGDECEKRVAQLEHALLTIYSMLATDPNWSDRLPPWDDLIEGKADARLIARARIIVPPGTPQQQP